MKTAIFKGYDEEGEVWAVGKTYGSGETETKFICPIEPIGAFLDKYKPTGRVNTALKTLFNEKNFERKEK